MSDEEKLDLFLKELAELTEKYGIDRCPLVNEHGCLTISDKNVLDLIIRQQERIEELEIITGLANNRQYYRKFVDEVFCKQKGKELSEPDFDYIYQLYFEQQAVIEQLQRNLKQCENGYSQQLHLARCKIEELKNLCTSEDKLIKELRAEIKQAKSEAIKEFAERLKEMAEHGWIISGVQDYAVSLDNIDNLVQKMVGGENA